MTARFAAPRKLVANSLLRHVTKQQLSRHQEAAQLHRKQKSGAGTAGIVIAIGLVILLIGGLIGGANIVATIGGVTFLVGLILLVIALVKG